MSEHSEIEELCALAAIGQVTPDELAQLRTHMVECPSCKQTFEGFVEINAVWLSQAEPLSQPPSDLRNRILLKAQESGARFSGPLRREIASGSLMSPDIPLPSRMRAPVWVVAVMFALGGLIGFVTAKFRGSTPSHVALRAPAPQPVVPAEPSGTPSSTDSNLLQSDKSDVERKLADAAAEQARLKSEAQALRQQVVSLEQARQGDADSIAELRSASDSNRSVAFSAQSELERLKTDQSSKDAEIIAAQVRLRELEDKLKSEEKADASAAQLAKGNDLRDLIGARNLHIIDVADVDRGGVKRPFGRVFYTEGKSLIFYAYDLSKTKSSQMFYVWGRREGDPGSNQALGALKNDDPGQARWVFSLNDEKVLASIDSVYVTLEPKGRPESQPKGRKILNAYLGTPANHP